MVSEISEMSLRDLDLPVSNLQISEIFLFWLSANYLHRQLFSELSNFQ